MGLKPIPWLQIPHGIKNVYNFCIVDNFVEYDKQIFFNDLEEGEHFEVLPTSTTYWDILVKTGIFDSKRACAGAGIEKFIPDGYSDFFIKNRSRYFYIFKRTKSWEELDKIWHQEFLDNGHTDEEWEEMVNLK